MNSVIPRVALPRPTRHVAFDHDVRVHDGVGEDKVTKRVPLGPEGACAVVDERTALLPPPATYGALRRMARAGRAERAAASRFDHTPAWVTGATLGTMGSTLWWAIASLRNGGESPLGVLGVCAVISGGAGFGAFMALFVVLSDVGDVHFPRDAIHEV